MRRLPARCRAFTRALATVTALPVGAAALVATQSAQAQGVALASPESPGQPSRSVEIPSPQAPGRPPRSSAPGRGLIITGAVVFALSYGGAVVMAFSFLDQGRAEWAWLFVPVLGAAVSAGERAPFPDHIGFYRPYMTVLAIAQAVSVATVGIGIYLLTRRDGSPRSPRAVLNLMLASGEAVVSLRTWF